MSFDVEHAPARAMVIVAHPDDAEFGCAGLVRFWANQGCAVTYVICTNGNKGSNDPTMTEEMLVPVREQEQRAAAALLGVPEVFFLGHPDGGLENTPALRERLVYLIRRFRPQVLLAMDPYRRLAPYISHRDHRMAAQAALDAAYPEAGSALYHPQHLQEGLLPHRIEEVFLAGSDEPSFWVDISEVFPIKVAALQCHVSQFASLEDVATMARELSGRVGEAKGITLAEAFFRMKLPWDPFGLP